MRSASENGTGSNAHKHSGLSRAIKRIGAIPTGGIFAQTGVLDAAEDREPACREIRRSFAKG